MTDGRERRSATLRRFARRWGIVAGLAALGLVGGVGGACSPARLIVMDHRVVSGTDGPAALVGDEVTDLGALELVAFYKAVGEAATFVTHDAGPTIVDFVHFVDVEPREEREPDRVVRLSLLKTVQHASISGGSININLESLCEQELTTIPLSYQITLRNAGNVRIERIRLLDALPPDFAVDSVDILDTQRAANMAGTIFFWWVGFVYVPDQSKVDFDELYWDIRQRGEQQLLIVEMNMSSAPLETDDSYSFVILRVKGQLDVPRHLCRGGAS